MAGEWRARKNREADAMRDKAVMERLSWGIGGQWISLATLTECLDIATDSMHGWSSACDAIEYTITEAESSSRD